MSNNPPTIQTLSAKCRDCYRCLRHCPVKAIKVKEGQTLIMDEQCLACGTCIRECPQKAKICRNDIPRLQMLFEQKAPIAVSLAPSVVSLFGQKNLGRLITVLKKLGFSYVSETALAAHVVTQASLEYHLKNPEKITITTACPSVVLYIQKYYPDLTDYLAPVLSPMLLHGKMLKNKLGEEWKTVFIGPCSAKKKELELFNDLSSIDVVLTVKELMDWIENRQIDLLSCEETLFDEPFPGVSRLFPLPGGLLQTMKSFYSNDIKTFSAEGSEQLKEYLEWIRNHKPEGLFEFLFCPGGCVQGAGIPELKNRFESHAIIKDYTPHQNPLINLGQYIPLADCKYNSDPLPSIIFSEEQIQKVLDQTGKSLPEHQLNCGACGYPNCREKAIAVLKGMAETEMCVPFMRRLAEQRADKVMSTSPNGIIILDNTLTVLHLNPAFKDFFNCNDSLLGLKISRLLDPAPFEKVASGSCEIYDSTFHYEAGSKIFHTLIYPLKKEKQIVGMFIDMTSVFQNQKEMDDLKKNTVLQARQLLNHQIMIAQKIVDFLGESTAQSELLVKKLSEYSNPNLPEKK